MESHLSYHFNSYSWSCFGGCCTTIDSQAKSNSFLSGFGIPAASEGLRKD
jgi:hypothetical protein